MVLGGTLRPLPSEPIAGRNPLLQGRESGIPGSGNCAIARAATPVPSRTRRPPLFTMIWVQRRTGGRSRLTTVLAWSLSLRSRPRRHPALPETRFTGAGSCCPIMGRQDPGLSPWPYTLCISGFPLPPGLTPRREVAFSGPSLRGTRVADVLLSLPGLRPGRPTDPRLGLDRWTSTRTAE